MRYAHIGFPLAGIALLAILVVYTGGFFQHGGIGPESPADQKSAAALPAEQTAIARVQHIPQVSTAPGTVRPRSQVRIEAQVQAKIAAVQVRAGQEVTKGETLVRLDDARFTAEVQRAEQKLKQRRAKLTTARHNVPAARSAYNASKAEWERIQAYFRAEAATEKELEKTRASFDRARAELDQAHSAVLQARAGVEAARNQLQSRRIQRQYATLTAPADGQVAERHVDPGDISRPGKPLLKLHTDTALRLEARISESRLGPLRLGSSYPVHFSAIDTQVSGTVEEILPAADPRTRSFTVKLALPQTPGLHAGMYGRLEFEHGSREAILVPRRAIREIGQLDIVRIRNGNTWRDIAVTTGHTRGEQIEILSGVAPGETVALFGGDHGT